MALDVYDYRTDIRNVVVTPEIRSRFIRMQPGAVATRHSHYLGHEVFLVLEGRAEFEIDGERAVLGSGQMCFARAEQMHQVRVIGDEPITLYVSVTPHLEPTHTMWDGQGQREPPRYGTATAAERAEHRGAREPTREVVDRHVARAKALAETAAENEAAQEAGAVALKRAQAAGDPAAVKAAVDAMSERICLTYKSFRALELSWNDLAVSVSET